MARAKLKLCNQAICIPQYFVMRPVFIASIIYLFLYLPTTRLSTTKAALGQDLVWCARPAWTTKVLESSTLLNHQRSSTGKCSRSCIILESLHKVGLSCFGANYRATGLSLRFTRLHDHTCMLHALGWWILCFETKSGVRETLKVSENKNTPGLESLLLLRRERLNF